MHWKEIHLAIYLIIICLWGKKKYNIFSIATMIIFMFFVLVTSILPGVYTTGGITECKNTPVYFTARASGLPGAGGFSVGNKSEESVGKHNDPDCKLAVFVDGSWKYETGQVTSKNPSWNERFQLSLGKDLRFEIWDVDPPGNPDDKIGTAYISYETLIKMAGNSTKTLKTTSSYGDAELILWRCANFATCCPPGNFCNHVRL